MPDTSGVQSLAPGIAIRDRNHRPPSNKPGTFAQDRVDRPQDLPDPQRNLHHPQTRVEVIPQLSEGAIVVTSNKLPSINLDASLRTVTEIERVIRSFPDVQTVVSQTGSAATPADPMGVESTDSYVILKPQSRWTTASTQQGIRMGRQSGSNVRPRAAFAKSAVLEHGRTKSGRVGPVNMLITAKARAWADQLDPPML